MTFHKKNHKKNKTTKTHKKKHIKPQNVMLSEESNSFFGRMCLPTPAKEAESRVIEWRSVKKR